MAAVLRQVVGEIEVIWELFAPKTLEHRWYFLDYTSLSMEDEICGLFMEGKSEFTMMEADKSQPSKRSRREQSCEKAIIPSYSTVIMDHQIWKELPEDIFEAVVARLPIAALFRFRLVSRNWNSWLTSNSFSQHCAKVVQQHPWFYTITHEDLNCGAMYDPTLKKWHHPAIPFRPGKVVFPVASAGGLVCFLDISHTNFYVCNPLTRSFKELPPRSVSIWSRVTVGMILNGKNSSCGYKIVWLGTNGDYEIYDSLKNIWLHPGIVPPSITLPLFLNLMSQAVTVGSTLFFIRANPDGIISYDLGTGGWKQFIIPLPPNLTDHTLAECGGQLILVGLVSKNAVTCVCIWELQKMTLLWKEVDRMPNIWCLDFYGKHVRMTCLGNQGLLMLSLRSSRTNCLVTYDAPNREWCKVLPDFMLPRGRKGQWIACGTAFYPCPTAVA